MPKDDTDARWTLSKEALEKLLARFSPDREEASRQLLLMRARLVRSFERRQCSYAEELVDRTVNVVTRKIDQGENIFNLPGYFLSVADIVFKEWLKNYKRLVPLDEEHDLPDWRPPEDEEKETRLRCLDECLGNLPGEKRGLILDYYSSDTARAKINNRRDLADKSTMNALRIRMCRIRKDLEKCVKDCLQRKTDSK